MIGAARYFPNRYFAPRYWPKVGEDPAPVTDTWEASQFRSGGTSYVARHQFPASGSPMGHLHHALTLLRAGMRPAGV